MTFDPNVGGALMFGGGTPFNTAETWTYDGTTWTQLAPATSPTARFGAQLAYDLNRGVSVLVGGWTSNLSIGTPSNQTWEFDGSTWTLAAPTVLAPNRYWHGLCHDMVRGRTVLYGGASSGLLGATNQTFEYDGTTWAQIATAANPGMLARPAMCYHLGIGKAVLFGGSNYSVGGSGSNATWLYDGTNWTLVPAGGSVPAARTAATMVYDNVRGVCVLTGGMDDGGNYLNDTWQFDGTTWTQLPTLAQASRDHCSAYLPASRKVLKSGGHVAAPNVLSNQTWEFGATTESYGVGCIGTAGVPVLVANEARIGENFTATLFGLHPAAPIAIFVFGVSEVPGIPLDSFGLTGCQAWVTLDFSFVQPAAAGQSMLSWNPVIAGVGQVIYGQGVSFDPVNPFGATVSNAIRVTTGY
jgi:hypothetical protein